MEIEWALQEIPKISAGRVKWETILFLTSEAVEACNALVTYGGSLFPIGPKSVIEIALRANDIAIFGHAALGIAIVDAMRYIAERFGAHPAIRESP